MSEPEIWRSVPDRPGYEASSHGRIRSTRWSLNRTHHDLADTPRVKVQRVNDNGYCVVGIGHTKTMRVHRLVSAAFLGPIPSGMDVNHRDGDKQNNRPENLEYVTRSENHRHAFRLGLSTSPFTGRLGERHFAAKLSERDVLAIRESFASGVTRRALAAQYGLSYYTVWDITQRRSWTHV